MPPEIDASQRLREILQHQFSLSAESIDSIMQEASSSSGSAGLIAMRRGLIDTVQSDIFETLSRPHDILPDYEFETVLGRGAMGVVYRARQKSLDRSVAIKTVLLGHSANEAGLRRFEQEAKTIAKLKHPNIVGAIALQRHGGRLFLVMELLDGQPLDEWLKSRPPVSEFETWWIIRQTASALAHAAEAHVVHRDIKPSNLFAVPTPPGFPLPAGVPLIKLTDFGLATLHESTEADATRLTHNGTTVGTPSYMAPEQADSSEVDLRADIYALGCTAFRLLSGAAPFTGTVLQIINQKLHQDAPDIRTVATHVTAESATLISQMVQRDREQRLGSYAELLASIDRLLEAGGTTSDHISSGSTSTRDGTNPVAAHDEATRTFAAISDSAAVTQPPRTRRRGKLIGLLVLVIGLVVGGWWLRPQPVEFRRELQPIGKVETLLDTVDVKAWRHASRGTQVSAGQDREGTPVLDMKGSVTRRLPEAEFYEVSVHVDLRKSSLLTLGFGPDANQVARVAVIRRDRIELGLRPLAGGEVNVASSKPLAFDPWAESTEETPMYVDIKIARQPSGWGLFFSNEFIGAMPLEGRAAISEISLNSDGGRVSVAEATFVALEPAGQ